MEFEIIYIKFKILIYRLFWQENSINNSVKILNNCYCKFIYFKPFYVIIRP